MIRKILKENWGYITLILILLILFLIIKFSFFDVVQGVDEKAMRFFQANMITEFNTEFMKILTMLGGAIPLILIVVLAFIFIKNKTIPFYMMFNLVWVFMISVVFKNIFMRERPMISLIEKPGDFSFPSGHTMCSVAFYGFLVYLIISNTKNMFLKWITMFGFSMLVIFIGLSRIYLNVHYLTDVLAGFVLGFICLLMFINIYRKNVVG